MDRAQLLPYFGTLAETPQAAAKMRNFVLSLAVRGQLLPQNADDGKHLPWKEFGAKFARANPQETSAPPFLAPKSWRWVRLNDVADYTAAEKVDPSEIKDGDWVLDLEEIEKDTSRIIRFASCAEKQSRSTKARFLPGDVLYGKLRPYLNKVVVAPKGGFCTTEIVPIRSRGIIEPTYLCIYLRSPNFVGYANSKSYGMKMPRLGTDDAESAWVAVPPPAEQRRIVAKVEELLALCDELEARQIAAREHRTRFVRSAFDHLTTAQDETDFKKHSSFCIQHSEFLFDAVPALRQAILSLAIQGLLAPRIAEECDNAPQRSSATLTAPVNCPLHWHWVRLETVLAFGPTNGLSPKPVSCPTKTRALTLTATTSGKFRADCFKYIAQEVEADSDLWLRSSDILIQRGNSLEYVGVAAVYEGAEHQFIYPDLMTKIRVVNWVDPRFAHLVLTSPFGREFFRSRATGTSGSMPKINHSVVRDFPFPVLPLKEQQRIVAKVDELMRWCDELESRLAIAQTAAAALLDSTLAKILSTSTESLADEPIKFARLDSVWKELIALWPSSLGFENAEPQPEAHRSSSVKFAPPETASALEDTFGHFWLLGMTKDFRKSIRAIDRKLQGRILEAINDISEDPVTPKGDTVKPLTGDLKEYWRYRIGDFRLVYLPNREKHQITLHTFAPRGGVYD